MLLIEVKNIDLINVLHGGIFINNNLSIPLNRIIYNVLSFKDQKFWKFTMIVL